VAKMLRRRTGKVKLRAKEHTVVEEFADVICKHRDQGLLALARLARVAFELSVGARASRQDKLALALARGLEARQRLAQAEGGSLSSDEVARLLGISKTAVLKWLRAGRLLAWREERRQAARFPCWQFDWHGQTLAGLEAVLEVLSRGERLDAWAKILFFLQTRPSLGEKRPLDLLRKGKLEKVRLAAAAYVE
jgi:excisionase family DNA binding protein